MKKFILILIIIILIIFVSVYVTKVQPGEIDKPVDEIEEVEMTDEEVADEEEVMEDEITDTSEVEEEIGRVDITVNDVDTSVAGTYTEYTPEAYKEAAGKKRVLFFYASWCPFCRGADEAFLANLDKIPEDVVLLKMDYDTEVELEKKYGVTYQHTFVYVDENGEAITVWNGGDINELIENTQ